MHSGKQQYQGCRISNTNRSNDIIFETGSNPILLGYTIRQCEVNFD